MAINRQRPNSEGEREADFLNIVVWRKQAENLKDYMSKGSRIGVEGSIQTRNYDDANGNKRYVTEIVASNVEFLESKKDSKQTEQQPTTQPVSTPSERNPYEEFGEQIDIDESELPFGD